MRIQPRKPNRNIASPTPETGSFVDKRGEKGRGFLVKEGLGQGRIMAVWEKETST
jgi:hypothetical protein